MFYLQSAKQITLLLSVILIALFTSFTPCLADDKPKYKNPSGEWQLFINPSKDFRILLPPNVKEGWDDAKQLKEDKREGIERYQASGVQHGFFVSLVPVRVEDFEDIQKQVHTSLKEEGYSNFSEAKKLKGNNWQAIVFDMESDGAKFTCLTGMDNENTELFMVLTTLPASDPKFAKLTDSLYLDSQLAKEKEDKRIAAVYKKLFSPKTIPEFIGLILFCGGLIAALVGGLWLWVEGFKVNFFWSLGMLLLPFVGLIFLCIHPGKAWRPVVVNIAGIISFVIGAFLVPH